MEDKKVISKRGHKVLEKIEWLQDLMKEGDRITIWKDEMNFSPKGKEGRTWGVKK